MEFQVNLINVPDLDDLTGWEVFDLMINARHVAGNYWIFEGDIGSLLCSDDITLADIGISEGFGDLNDEEILEHCRDVFGMSLENCDPGWKMLSNKVSNHVRF